MLTSLGPHVISPAQIALLTLTLAIHTLTQVLHPDCLFHRRACRLHVGADACGAGLAPADVETSRPALAYDGVRLIR